MFEPLTASLLLPRGTGRPRTRPDRVLGDKAHSGKADRVRLRTRKIKATIAQPRDRSEHRRRTGSAGGGPPVFDRVAYRGRDTVERAIDLLKQNRAGATRYDKRAARRDRAAGLDPAP